MNVLIVDDSELFRELIRSVLSRSDPRLSISEAEDQVSGEALLRKQWVDVAYLDICLPDGNGLHLAARLRAVNPIATVACCTGHDLPEYRDEAKRRGADFFLPKESLTSAQILGVFEEGRRRAVECPRAEGLG